MAKINLNSYFDEDDNYDSEFDESYSTNTNKNTHTGRENKKVKKMRN